MKSLLSLGALIDTSFEHYKKHLPSILGTTLWLLAAAIPSAIGIVLSQDGDAVNVTTWMSFGFSALGGIIGVLASIHISVALIASLREQKEGNITDPRVFLKKAFSLDLSYVWATILKSIFVGIIPLIPLLISIGAFSFALRSENGMLVNVLAIVAFVTILLALGGALKFSLHYNFVPYATVLDGKRGMESLRTSAALVKGRWWPIFWRVFLPKALYTLIFVVILAGTLWTTGIIGIALSQGSFFLAKLFALTNFFISTLINAFLIPILLLNDYYVYENLRETK
ncbi:MAG: hypothetical protein AAB448_01135 [Patescibacteria group bacterium]